MEKKSLKDKIYHYYLYYKFKTAVFLIDKHNSLEYYINLLINTPPKYRKKETVEHWLERCTPSQAVNYTRYNATKWRISAAYCAMGIPEGYSEEETEMLKKLSDTIFNARDYWNHLFAESIRRKNLEKD